MTTIANHIALSEFDLMNGSEEILPLKFVEHKSVTSDEVLACVKFMQARDGWDCVNFDQIGFEMFPELSSYVRYDMQDPIEAALENLHACGELVFCQPTSTEWDPIERDHYWDTESVRLAVEQGKEIHNCEFAVLQLREWN